MHPLESAAPIVDHRGLDVLAWDECLRLLARAGVGRIGLSVDSLPAVLPVNFTLDGASIVFASEEGTKLDAARTNAVVCFEVDDFERLSHEGWSVNAVGRLTEITDPDELVAARRLPLSPWAPDGSSHHIRMPIVLLTGRRIRRA